MSARTLWLGDHELVDRIGHHLFYNCSLATGARAEGMNAIVLCQKNYLFEPLDGIEMEEFFRRDWRARPPAWAVRSRRLLDLLEKLARRRFFRDLVCGLPPSRVKESDVIFAQMLAPRHLAGWLHWLARLKPGHAPALALHLGYDPNRFAADAGIRTGFLRAEQNGLAKKVLLISDSEPLAARYEEFLHRKVKILPHVVPPGIAVRRKRDADSPITFCYLGNPRREKGFVDIAAAVPHLSGAGMRFVLQVVSPDAACAESVARLKAAKLPNVELVEGLLTREEYLARLEAADVMLVAYHLDKHGDRTSGIFCEALVAGKPVITTEDSWMSLETAASGVGWLVPERNPAALAAIITRAVGEYSVVVQKTLSLAAHYEQEFSGQNFVRNLVRIADDESR
ncbi:MAG: glycosyltransferase [Terrimicrobiaceae bacterium]